MLAASVSLNRTAHWVQDVDDKRRKAIKKVVDKEDKARAPVVKKQEQNAEYLSRLQVEVEQLTQQVSDLNAKLQ